MATRMSTQERRKDPRVAGSLPVSISSAEWQCQTQTQNLSASGVYITLEQFIAPMSKLQLRFELPNGAKNSAIEATGAVVRIEPAIEAAQRSRYNVAIFFTDISARDRAIIKKFVSQRMTVKNAADA